MITLTPQTPTDLPAIEALLDQAFGPARTRKTSYRYRDGIEPVHALSTIARDANGHLLGSIRYWPLMIGGDAHSTLLLGPLAIDPQRKGQGIGSALMRATMQAAAGIGYRAALLVGDLPYYRRFGFGSAQPFGVVMPGEDPARVLLSALPPHSLPPLHGPVRRAGAATVPDHAALADVA